MKPLALLFVLTALTSSYADPLGTDIRITPLRGWVLEAASAPGEAAPVFPTLRYSPKDGRNASIILTLFPLSAAGFKVTNHASLERFNLLSAQPYLAGQEHDPVPTVLEVANGIGVSITNEDPALIGKPVPPGEYRIATSASLLVAGKHLINCTVFYDEKDSTDFREAMAILQSARTSSTGPEAASNHTL